MDHGKSTCAGALLESVGHFSKHEVEQTMQEAVNNKMEKWKYAYLLDATNEERARGKTHEYTTVNFSYNNQDYELIDTPGHKSFVRSTIEALALRSDVVAVVVLSVIQSEFESGFDRGMMKEQMILARACGITNFVIALNKMDAIDWDKEPVKEIVKGVKRFLKSLGTTTVSFVPISAYNKENLVGKESSLMDTIAGKFNGQPEEKGEKVKEENGVYSSTARFQVQIKVLHCDNIILPAYQCIVHVNSKEKEVEIDDDLQVKNDSNRPFAKKGDVFIATLNVLGDTAVQVKEGDKVILRSRDKTIGFGNVVCK